MRQLLMATAATAMLLTGCSILSPQKVTLTTSFNPDEAKALLKDGKNTIKGSALLRQNGGAVVTCAGREVGLIPVTPYSSERMSYIYGNTFQGYAPSRNYGGIVFTNNDPEYLKHIKSTTCDAQGFFKFNNITDGDFYLITIIDWKIDYSPQGGRLMKQVSVKGGQTTEVVLTY